VIVETRNFVSQPDIAYIKRCMGEHCAANPGSMQSGFYNRGGNTVSISAASGLRSLDNLLHDIFNKYYHEVIANTFRPSAESGDSGYEYHIYNPGDVCKSHVDSEIPAISTGESLLRYASVVLHLNTVKEGGELVFPEQNVRIKTEEGKIVAFPPYGTHPHYVTSSSEPREIIMTWFIYANVSVLSASV